MGYVVLLLLSVGVTIYALVDCWRSSDDEVRGLPRPAWFLLILLIGPMGFPPIGGALYLALGRPAPFPRQGRVLAPDDDPEFLRSLDVERRRTEAERRRREQRERKEREKQERQQRKDLLKNDPTTSGPETPDGETRP